MGLPQLKFANTHLYLGGERYFESEASCPQSTTGQDFNLNHSLTLSSWLVGNQKCTLLLQYIQNLYSIASIQIWNLFLIFARILVWIHGTRRSGHLKRTAIKCRHFLWLVLKRQVQRLYTHSWRCIQISWAMNRVLIHMKRSSSSMGTITSGVWTGECSDASYHTAVAVRGKWLWSPTKFIIICFC